MLNLSDSFPRFCAVLAIVTPLAGCIVPEETRGSVTQYNGNSVTVRGVFSVGDGEVARPTAGMIAQAREICPGAEYLSAIPTPDNLDTFEYLFRCP